jgi:hypothetical protein
MNILYVLGALLLLVVLGYPYIILVVANKQQGATKRMGQVLAGLFVLTLVLLILLYQTGIAQMPGFRLMGDRPTTRMVQGMSGYVTGMMLEDEQAMDEFISTLKAKPELYDRFKKKLGP